MHQRFNHSNQLSTSAQATSVYLKMFTFICFSVLLISASCLGAEERSSLCKSRNMYLKVDGQCDSYIECLDFQALNMQCPDGLHFDPSASWPIYPCGYPQDVVCTGRGISQPAVPTGDCPHQYGYFPSPLASASDCGHYRICNGGKSSEMYCPSGLAFNPATARCDWPDRVPTCNVEEYVGYKCPPAAIDEEGNPMVTNHKYENDCYSFFSCVNGLPRLLSCDAGYAFDDSTGRCEDADTVNCVSRAVPQ